MVAQVRTGWLHIGLAILLSLPLLMLALIRSDAQVPDLGIDADMHQKVIFPLGALSVINTDISSYPVDPNSANLMASIGLTSPLHPDFGTTYHNAPIGMDYIVVSGTQALVPITFTIPSESDPSPYPIPSNAPIEGGSKSRGDRHVLVIDRDNWIGWEMYKSFEQNGGASWSCYSGAMFNLSTGAERPICWTSADAAGLPIFPLLVRYDEAVTYGVIPHALRFTVSTTRQAFTDPARHYASNNTGVNVPPMGMRIRLKASVDISHFSATNQVILTALKKYGAFLADNGSNMYISGSHDSRWNDSDLHNLSSLTATDFEVVQMGTIITTCP